MQDRKKRTGKFLRNQIIASAAPQLARLGAGFLPAFCRSSRNCPVKAPPGLHPRSRLEALRFEASRRLNERDDGITLIPVESWEFLPDWQFP